MIPRSTPPVRPCIQVLKGLWRLLLLTALLSLLPEAARALTLQSHGYTYNAAGQMSSDTDASGKVTHYYYDNNGNRTSSIDPLGRVTCYTYDGKDRLHSVAGPLAPNTSCYSSNLSPQTTYAYDSLSHLQTVTDPLGHITTYTYNGLDQLLSQSSPDTGTTGFTYSTGAGDTANLTSQRTNAASQQTGITYDLLDRPGTITYADGRVVSYVYDQGANGIGHLTSVSDAQSGISWTYDVHGRILSRTQTLAAAGSNPAQSWLLQYAYNSVGQLIQLTYPSGLVVSYSYDSLGRVQSLSQNGNTVLGNITYRPFGGITGWTWANGSTHQRTYDQSGKLSTLSVANTSLIFSYDDVQRLTQSQDISNNATQTYSYDNQDRLSNYVGLSSTRAWTYDANGNRLSQSISAATDSYVIAPGSNRLNRVTPLGSRSNLADIVVTPDGGKAATPKVTT